jgi:hypothetical protein
LVIEISPLTEIYGRLGNYTFRARFHMPSGRAGKSVLFKPLAAKRANRATQAVTRKDEALRLADGPAAAEGLIPANAALAFCSNDD